MAESPPHPLAPLYSLARFVLNKDGSTEEARKAAFHTFIEKVEFKEIVKYEEQYDHTELFNLMLRVMKEAIDNYKDNKPCCHAAIECIGRGMGEVLWSLPDDLRCVQRLDENVMDFILHVIVSTEPSKRAMSGFSRACSAVLRWSEGYSHVEREAFSEKYSSTVGNYLHRLDYRDMAILMPYVAVRESAFNNSELITLIEEKLVTEVAEKEYVACVAVCLLGETGDDLEKLEELIGKGFMCASRTLAMGDMDVLGDEYLTDIVCLMNILDSVLFDFPICKATVKGLLAGSNNRFAADLEATIEIEPSRRAVYHLQWEEEEESTADTSESWVEAPRTQARMMVARDLEGFNALPQNVLVKIAGLLPFAELGSFRGTCRQASQAVTIHCEHVKLKELIDDLWPENTHQFATLNEILREVKILTSWASSDLIKSIDFSGISIMTSSQLEAAFGTEALLSVKKLVLKDVIVPPSTWKQLSLLCPNVTTVIYSEATSQLPDEIEDRSENRRVIVKNSAQLKRAGLLDDYRSQSLNDIAGLFRRIEKVHIE